MPTTVQNVAVTGDEAGMRVDRFLEARFPGLSFSHIQRVIRKGEVRVNGKRTQPKNRLEAGQTVRIPPLRLDQPKPRAPGNEADEKTRAFLKSITLYDDADVLVLNKPMGLAVQGGSGTTRHVDGMLEVLRDAHGQRPRLVHRLDKDTAGCLLVAKTRFAAAALAKTFRSRSARKIYWALVAGVPKVQQGRISTYLVKEEREDESLMRIARHGEKGASHCPGSRSSRLRAARISCAPTWRISIIRSSAIRNISRARIGNCPAACRTNCICSRVASWCRIRVAASSMPRHHCRRTCSNRGICSASTPRATTRSSKRRRNSSSPLVPAKAGIQKALQRRNGSPPSWDERDASGHLNVDR
jgi:23S rRNA-/tRNA-specific pseudouridylate synthase